MAEVLLIKREDVVTFTSMNGNVDSDKFMQYIKIAQDVHIENYLGSNLIAKLKADILATNLSGNYLVLVERWVTPALIHWAMYEAIPFLSITIANGGIYRMNPENAEPLTVSEVDKLVEKEKDLAVHYTNRMVDYICNNSSLFPEYFTNNNEDVSPTSRVNYTGWVL